jgi:hypothetical protein
MNGSGKQNSLNASVIGVQVKTLLLESHVHPVIHDNLNNP